MSRHVSRTALLILLGCLACAAEGAAVDDRYAADPKLRRFVDTMHGETAAVHLGRIVYRKRWDELLNETLYQITPRGVWDPSHPGMARSTFGARRFAATTIGQVACGQPR